MDQTNIGPPFPEPRPLYARRAVGLCIGAAIVQWAVAGILLFSDVPYSMPSTFRLVTVIVSGATLVAAYLLWSGCKGILEWMHIPPLAASVFGLMAFGQSVAKDPRWFGAMGLLVLNAAIGFILYRWARRPEVMSFCLKRDKGREGQKLLSAGEIGPGTGEAKPLAQTESPPAVVASTAVVLCVAFLFMLAFLDALPLHLVLILMVATPLTLVALAAHVYWRYVWPSREDNLEE